MIPIVDTGDKFKLLPTRIGIKVKCFGNIFPLNTGLGNHQVDGTLVRQGARLETWALRDTGRSRPALRGQELS